MTTKIRELREVKGVSQRKLGRALELPQSRISDIERGKRCVKLDEAVRIADFLNVRVDDLVIRKN